MASVIINNIENITTKEEIREKYKDYCVMRDGPYDGKLFKMNYYGTKIDDDDNLQYYVNNITYDSKNNTFTSDLDGYFVRICDCIPNYIQGGTIISDGNKVIVPGSDDLLFIETDNFLPSSRLFIRYSEDGEGSFVINFKGAKIYNDCSDVAEYYTYDILKLKELLSGRENIDDVIKRRELLFKSISDKVVYTFPSVGLTALCLKKDAPKIAPRLNRAKRAMS